ncbi:MAG: glycosyltransferase family A protein [Spirosomataceae bacterium]
MKKSPLVTVICLCYNQAPYLPEALQSVLAQTYPSLELIIADDASTDASPALIRAFAERHPFVKLVLNTQNQGNCRTFNQALQLAQGKYLIDLAADDVLLPHRVEQQVAAIEKAGECCALVFSNAAYIDHQGRFLRNYFPINHQEKATKSVPSGQVYRQVLSEDFICPPTTLFRTQALNALGGYDESLSYEDFDIWIRLARDYELVYVDTITTQRRVVRNSWGAQFWKKKNPHLASSLVICQKAFNLNQTPDEHLALAKRIRYFIRQCWFMHQFELALAFEKLLRQCDTMDLVTLLVLQGCRWQIPVHPLYKLYRIVKAVRRS